MKKIMIASDIHGSAYFCRKTLEAYKKSGAARLILLGDILYHGPRNNLPEEYAPQDARSGYRSIERFLAECCDFEPEAEVTTQTLFEAYCGYEDAVQISWIDFSRTLKEQLDQNPQVSALKRVSGREQRGYRGIRLLPQF